MIKQSRFFTIKGTVYLYYVAYRSILFIVWRVPRILDEFIKKRQLPVTVCSQKNKEISIRASRQYEVHLFPHIKSYANKIFYICLKYCTANEMNKNIMMIAKTQRYMHLFSFHCIALLLHFIMNSMYYICHFILDISFYFKFYFY